MRTYIQTTNDNSNGAYVKVEGRFLYPRRLLIPIISQNKIPKRVSALIFHLLLAFICSASLHASGCDDMALLGLKLLKMLLSLDEPCTCREAMLTMSKCYWAMDHVPCREAALDGAMLDGAMLDRVALDGAALDWEAACSTSGCLLIPCLHSKHVAELSGSGVKCSQSQLPSPPLQNSCAIRGTEWTSWIAKGPDDSVSHPCKSGSSDMYICL